jgi:hypothetical protein
VFVRVATPAAIDVVKPDVFGLPETVPVLIDDKPAALKSEIDAILRSCLIWGFDKIDSAMTPYTNIQAPSLVDAVQQNSVVSAAYLEWIASIPRNMDVQTFAQWFTNNPRPPLIDHDKLLALENLRDEVTLALQEINRKITYAYAAKGQ